MLAAVAPNEAMLMFSAKAVVINNTPIEPYKALIEIDRIGLPLGYGAFKFAFLQFDFVAGRKHVLIQNRITWNVERLIRRSQLKITEASTNVLYDGWRLTVILKGKRDTRYELDNQIISNSRAMLSNASYVVLFDDYENLGTLRLRENVNALPCQASLPVGDDDKNDCEKCYNKCGKGSNSFVSGVKKNRNFAKPQDYTGSIAVFFVGFFSMLAFAGLLNGYFAWVDKR